MVGAVALRDQPRVGELVERPLLEADGERAHRLGALLRRERRQRQESTPPESRTPTGTSATRCARTESRSRARSSSASSAVVLGAHVGSRDRAPAARSGRAALPPSSSRRGGARAAACATSRKIVSGAGTELKARYASSASRSISRQPGGEQRLQLRGEGELAAVVAVVERLDAEAVAGEHEPAPARVPERDREHPAQRARRSDRRAPRRGAARTSVSPSRAEAVARRARARRAARGSCRSRRSGRPRRVPSSFAIGWSPVVEVDDREPPVREPDAGRRGTRRRVRPAVEERRRSSPRAGRGRGAAGRERFRRSRTCGITLVTQ